MNFYFLLFFSHVFSFISKQYREDNAETINLNQIYINKINSTHFSCDNNTKILTIDKFNDDYCDCEDGSDENKTNACINGKFYCNNYLYYPKIISTSKINDEICDCCDGSDESNFHCPNKCLYLSNLEYKSIKEEFLNIISVLSSYTEDKTKEYFNDTFNYINEIKNRYKLIKELYSDKVLIERYLNNSNIQKNESFISDRDLNKILKIINNKIDTYKKDLIEEEDNIFSLIKMGILSELLGNNKLKLNFDDYNCELTKDRFYCNYEIRGTKPMKGADKLNFGQLNYIKNNVAVFNRGYDCKGYPGVSLTAEIIFLCAPKNEFKLNYIDNNCFYSFFYYTYFGCNNANINNMINKIDNILNH